MFVRFLGREDLCLNLVCSYLDIESSILDIRIIVFMDCFYRFPFKIKVFVTLGG